MQEMFRKLSDFFFVTGTFATGLGVLTIVSAQGGFDGLAYIFYSLGVRLGGSDNKWKSRKSFLEFRQERQEKKRSRKGLIVFGLVALALAVVFALCY